MLLQSGSRVMFFGDSIVKASDALSTGYVRLMRTWLTANLPTLNVTLIASGVSGDRVAQLQARFNAHVIPKAPTIVVVSIGVNDAGANNKIPTPLATYEAGLRDVITRVIAINSVPVLATPALIGEKVNGANPLDGQLEQYCQRSRDVAASLGVSLIDLRAICTDYLTRFNVKNASEDVLTDEGVHPNTTGHMVWAGAFLQALADRNV